MYTSVIDTLLKGKDTPLGVAISVSDNCQWLTLLMYATPHINISLPVLSSATSTTPTLPSDVKGSINNLINLIESNQNAIKQMTDYNMDDVYFLAQRATDKLAIATYTLYLYGKR